jgi:hypothetical protein
MCRCMMDIDESAGLKVPLKPQDVEKPARQNCLEGANDTAELSLRLSSPKQCALGAFNLRETAKIVKDNSSYQ